MRTDASRLAFACILVAACSSPAPKADAPITQSGHIVCGAAACDAASEDCCIAGDWTLTCAPKGSCVSAGGTLSCTSPASCGGSQSCCATQEMPSTHSQCSPSACATYTLCESAADCSGKPCDQLLLPNGPTACNLCSGVSCGAGQMCCASTGQCYAAGCGSCCR